MSSLLTREDMQELTGRIQGKSQIDALLEMGFIRDIHFRVRPDGKPVMTWDALKPQQPTKNIPRFELIENDAAA